MMGTQVLSAGTLTGDDVQNPAGEDLGKIVELTIDLDSGQVVYAVLSFGGVLGIGDKLFAIPWQALTVDTARKRFILDEDKQRLKDAPGFDQDHWPNMADPEWGTRMHEYFGYAPYWGASHSWRETALNPAFRRTRRRGCPG